MRFFDELGSRIHEEWKRQDFDTRAFPAIAARALEAMPPSASVTPLDVVRWIHTTPTLFPQVELASTFGDPPITVYRCERFYIEVLYWVDGTTSIHQHGFSGAFHVMEGSSLHSTFDFTPRRRFCDQLVHGDVRLRHAELLTKGAVRPIEGKDTIHSLFHLDRPSVSVVVRTYNDPFAGPQYSYLRPGMAVDPFFVSDRLRRQQQTLTLLHGIEAPDYDDWLYRLLAASDAHSFFSLLMVAVKQAPPARLDAVLDRLETERSELVGMMRPVLSEHRRELNIISRRSKIRDAEHRFFLAVLLNVPKRSIVDRMIKARFPDREPTAKILEWVKALAATPLPNGEDGNVIGVELDESSLLLFECLLQGMPFDAILDRFKEDYSDEDVEAQRDDLSRMREAFVGSMLFKPLFEE